MLLVNHLKKFADRTHDKKLLIFRNSEFTFKEFDEITDRIAASFLRAGVKRGDRIVLFLKNCPELVFSYYACFKASAVAVPVNFRYKSRELSYAVTNCEARVLIVGDELFHKYVDARDSLHSVRKCYLVSDNKDTPADTSRFSDLMEQVDYDIRQPEIDGSDPAVILYTSGTTAKPKGVIHTHSSLLHTAINLAATQYMNPRDISIIPLPICHIFGFTGVLSTVYVGGTVVLMPKFEPESFIDSIDKYRPTTTTLLPFQLADIVNHERAQACDFSSFKHCLAGGDKVPTEIHKKFRDLLGIEITEGCGMTECCPYAVNPPIGPKKLGSIGMPVHATSLRLVDDSDKDIPEGDIGEVIVKSEANMAGYWNNEEDTSRALRDGWLYTGDLARVDEDGYYWFVCRKKDIIIRGGSNISPLEVEAVFYEHPAVKAVGVIGLPDEKLGEIVKAFVSLKKDFTPLPTEDELKTFVSSQIASYKVPKSIEFLEDVPLTAIGKVDRKKLRSLGYESGA
jgi:long-chain acyl-CoA synthetase